MANKTPPGRRCRRCRAWLASYASFPLARHVCKLCLSTTAPVPHPPRARRCTRCDAPYTSSSRKSLYCGNRCRSAAAGDARTARRRAEKAAKP